MKKKLLSCVLSLVMILTLFTGLIVPASAAGTGTISVENVTANQGETIEVEVRVQGEFSGAQIFVNFDNNALELEATSQGAQFPSGSMFYPNTPEVANANGVAFISSVGVTNSTVDGVLAVLTFTVKESAEDGQYALTVDRDDSMLSKITEDPMKPDKLDLTITDGSITVGSDEPTDPPTEPPTDPDEPTDPPTEPPTDPDEPTDPPTEPPTDPDQPTDPADPEYSGTLSVANVEVNPNGTVTVDVSYEGSIAGFQMKLGYDESAFDLISIEAGAAVPDGWMFLPDVGLGSFGLANYADADIDGVIARYTFKVLETAGIDEYALTVNDVYAVKGDGSGIDVTVADEGSITIVEGATDEPTDPPTDPDEPTDPEPVEPESSAVISVSSAQAKPDGTVVIEVSAKGYMSGIEFALEHDPDVLTLVEVEAGEACPSDWTVTRATTPETLRASFARITEPLNSDDTSGQFAAASNIDKNVEIDGVIARYTYKVAANAAVGTTSELTVTAANGYDEGVAFPATVTSNGSVEIVAAQTVIPGEDEDLTSPDTGDVDAWTLWAAAISLGGIALFVIVSAFVAKKQRV